MDIYLNFLAFEKIADYILFAVLLLFWVVVIWINKRG